MIFVVSVKFELNLLLEDAPEIPWTFIILLRTGAFIDWSKKPPNTSPLPFSHLSTVSGASHVICLQNFSFSFCRQGLARYSVSSSSSLSRHFLLVFLFRKALCVVIYRPLSYKENGFCKKIVQTRRENVLCSSYFFPRSDKLIHKEAFSLRFWPRRLILFSFPFLLCFLRSWTEFRAET